MLDRHGLLVLGIQDFRASREVTPELGRQLAREVSAEFAEVNVHDRHAVQALMVDLVRRFHAQREEEASSTPRNSTSSDKWNSGRPKLGLLTVMRRTFSLRSRKPRGTVRKRPPPSDGEDVESNVGPPRKRIDLGMRLEVDLGEKLTGEDVFQGTLRRHH
jgi:hypothetical protein